MQRQPEILEPALQQILADHPELALGIAHDVQKITNSLVKGEGAGSGPSGGTKTTLVRSPLMEPPYAMSRLWHPDPASLAHLGNRLLKACIGLMSKDYTATEENLKNPDPHILCFNELRIVSQGLDYQAIKVATDIQNDRYTELAEPVPVFFQAALLAGKWMTPKVIPALSRWVYDPWHSGEDVPERIMMLAASYAVGNEAIFKSTSAWLVIDPPGSRLDLAQLYRLEYDLPKLVAFRLLEKQKSLRDEFMLKLLSFAKEEDTCECGMLNCHLFSVLEAAGFTGESDMHNAIFQGSLWQLYVDLECVEDVGEHRKFTQPHRQWCSVYGGQVQGEGESGSRFQEMIHKVRSWRIEVALAARALRFPWQGLTFAEVKVDNLAKLEDAYITT